MTEEKKIAEEYEDEKTKEQKTIKKSGQRQEIHKDMDLPVMMFELWNP